MRPGSGPGRCASAARWPSAAAAAAGGPGACPGCFQRRGGRPCSGCPFTDRHPMSRVDGGDVSSVLRLAFLRRLALHAALALGSALRGSSFQKPSVRPLRVPITAAALDPSRGRSVRVRRRLERQPPALCDAHAPRTPSRGPGTCDEAAREERCSGVALAQVPAGIPGRAQPVGAGALLRRSQLLRCS